MGLPHPRSSLQEYVVFKKYFRKKSGKIFGRGLKKFRKKTNFGFQAFVEMAS
jgi:hypothetical protein